MAIEKFTLKSLTDMDGGRINAAFEHALARCYADCQDRPGAGKARRVTLDVNLTPVMGDDGQLESVNVHFKITDSVPKRESKTYNMTAGRGGLLFNELAPDDVRQTTIDQPKPRSMTDAG